MQKDRVWAEILQQLQVPTYSGYFLVSVRGGHPARNRTVAPFPRADVLAEGADNVRDYLRRA